MVAIPVLCPAVQCRTRWRVFQTVPYMSYSILPEVCTIKSIVYYTYRTYTTILLCSVRGGGGLSKQPKSKLRGKPTGDDGLQTYQTYLCISQNEKLCKDYESASIPWYAMRNVVHTVSWRIAVAKFSHAKIKLQYRDRCNPLQFPSRIDSEVKRCLKLDSPSTWHASVTGSFCLAKHRPSNINHHGDQPYFGNARTLKAPVSENRPALDVLFALLPYIWPWLSDLSLKYWVLFFSSFSSSLLHFSFNSSRQLIQTST